MSILKSMGKFLSGLVFASALSVGIPGCAIVPLKGLSYKNMHKELKKRNWATCSPLDEIKNDRQALLYFLVKGKNDLKSCASVKLGKSGDKTLIPFLEGMVNNHDFDLPTRALAQSAIRRLNPHEYFRMHFPHTLPRDYLLGNIETRFRKLSHTGNRGLSNLRTLDLHELTEVYFTMIELEQEDILKRIGEMIRADTHPGNIDIEGVKKDGTKGTFSVDATKTELGGLVNIIKEDPMQRFNFELYEPFKQEKNTSYISTWEMIGEPAIFRFHLHAIKPGGNPDVAFPSNADHRAANYYSTDCLVISYIGKTTKGEFRANIDFYTKDGVTIDLGDYVLPL